MGAHGTDVAIDSADVMLMGGDAEKVPLALRLSKATMQTIRQNLLWALFYNAVCIPVAMGALTPVGVTLNPMVGAAAMGFSSVFVVSNALRLFAWKPCGRAAAASAKDGVKVRKEGSPAQGAGADKKGSTPMASKTLDIEGMMCDHCVAHVTQALEGVRGVKNVHVSLDEKSATLDAGPLVSDKKLSKAVEEAGYKVVGIR